MTFGFDDTKVRVYELFIGATIAAVKEAAASVGLMDDIECILRPTLAERRCQQLHQQVMGHRLLGVQASIKGTIREITRANLLAALPWCGSAASEAIMPATLGSDLYALAKAVRLHPMDKAADSYTDDIFLIKCGRVSGLEQKMDGQNESGIPYEIVAYPDRSQLPSLILGYLGEPPAPYT